MNRQKLQLVASEWTRIAKNDIRNKVNEFMRENDATPRELAYVLAISEGELEQILNGNCEISLSTFAKLLIATGNALEIKPIEETPIGNYENIPDEPMPPIPPFGRMPRRNPFTEPTRTRRPFFTERTTTPRGPLDEDDEREESYGSRPQYSPEDIRDMFEHRFGERFKRHQAPSAERPSAPQRNREPESPFDVMDRQKMVDIIRKHLWDSEIDLYRASNEQLTSFLKEKDKRMKENKRLEELENDPAVNDFKERLKKTVDSNPHLKDWVKKLVGSLED